MKTTVPTRTLFQWAQDGALEERIKKVRKFRDHMKHKSKTAKRSDRPKYRARFEDATNELLRLELEREKR